MTKELSFWTDGKSFTGLLKSFWEEGRYESIYNTLSNGGLNLIAMKAFFELRSRFEGATNVGDGTLDYIVSDTIPEDFAEQLYWSLKNCSVKNKKARTLVVLNDDDEYESVSREYPENIEDFLSKKNFETISDLQILNKFFSREQIIDLLKEKIIINEGFGFNPSINDVDTYINGVILKDGTLITCGVQEHKDLFPFLNKLDLVESSDWINDKTTVHITSGQFSGRIENFNEAQIETLIKHKSVITRGYGEFETLMNSIFDNNAYEEDYGGKYNNLVFLKKYYPKIKLPKFSKEYEEGLTCLRTSPEYSLPGLLTSQFNITKENADEAIKTMVADFEKYKDVIKTNSFNGKSYSNTLHYFFQEKIEGLNGVCNIINNEFSYALSSTQGNIVEGKKGDSKLNEAQLNELKKITQTLSTDLGVSIQLEFVITETNEIYIVQLRELKNNAETTVIGQVPEKAKIQGKTFSKGIVECKLEDILIVKEDSKSEDLLDKKALIVTSDVQFSHVLALSKVLNIPSIYATGELPKLPDTIKIHAYNKEAFLCFG